jgi:hypothetical protein
MFECRCVGLRVKVTVGVGGGSGDPWAWCQKKLGNTARVGPVVTSPQRRQRRRPRGVVAGDVLVGSPSSS